MGASPRPRASIMTWPGVTRAPGSGSGSRIQGLRPLASAVGADVGAGVEVVVVATSVTVAAAPIAGGAGVDVTRAMGADVAGPDASDRGVPVAAAAPGVADPMLAPGTAVTGVLDEVVPVAAASAGVSEAKTAVLSAPTGVTATTGASVGGPALADDSAEPAAPAAETSAPTADQARLPSSRMPTMPTIVAISRAGEPSSDGGAGRATLTP